MLGCTCTGLVDFNKSHPRETKEKLAKEIITQYHSAKAADAAAVEFQRVHGGAAGGGLPDVIPEMSLPADKMASGRIGIVPLVCLCGFAKSNGEARRLILERGVRLNGQVVDDVTLSVDIANGDVVQRGKRRFVRLLVS